MRHNSTLYGLAVLKNKRAELAAQIVELERQLRYRKDSLVHVDATLKLLDPDLNVEGIPNKRLLPGRIKLFRQGELQRLILGALREATEPLRTIQIVDVVIAAGGHGASASAAISPRVRTNLSYLERRGKVVKIGERLETRWQLA